MTAPQLSPLAWSREAERQRAMARRAEAMGDALYARRHQQLARRYAARANEDTAH